MAGLKGGGEPRVDHGDGLIDGNEARADGDHLRVVMFFGQTRGVLIIDQRAADAGYFVGRDRNADPRAADQHAAVRRAIDDGAAGCFGVIRIIDRVRILRPDINNRVALLAQMLGDDLLVGKAGVIGTDGNGEKFHDVKKGGLERNLSRATELRRTGWALCCLTRIVVNPLLPAKPNFMKTQIAMAALALRLVQPRALVVVHWHSDIVRQRMSRRLYEPLQRWMLDRADAIVATSENYAGSSPVLQRWRSKVTVIPIGIGDGSGRSSGKRVAALRTFHSGKKIVFALGRMTYYKGFDALIDAAALLPDDCVVVIAGGGALLDRFRARVVALRLDQVG